MHEQPSPGGAGAIRNRRRASPPPYRSETTFNSRESSGSVLKAGFDIDRGVLSIGLSKNQFLSFMQQGGGAESDAGDQTFIDIVFGDTGQVRFYFTR